MELKAYLILENIRKIGDYGKINQKLLSLAFIKAGRKLLEEKSGQGIDLIIEAEGKKYAIEVKTTDTDEIKFEEKKEGYDKKRAQGLGFVPALAVIKVSPLSNWVIASSEGIHKVTLRIGMLCQKRISLLEEGIDDAYVQVLLDIGRKLLDEKPSSPQGWLDNLIRPQVVE